MRKRPKKRGLREPLNSTTCFIASQVWDLETKSFIFNTDAKKELVQRSEKWGITLSYGSAKRIQIFDTPLRDVEQIPGASPNPEKKLRITKRLDDTITDGYARVSGRLGVCMATSGFRATNPVTASVDAMINGINKLLLKNRKRPN